MAVTVVANANKATITISDGQDTYDVSMSIIKVDSDSKGNVNIWWRNGGNAGNGGGLTYAATLFTNPSGTAAQIQAAIAALIVPT